MATPRLFKIQESESEIKKLMKSSGAMIGKRLHGLLVFKRNELTGISKRRVAEKKGLINVIILLINNQESCPHLVEGKQLYALSG